MTTSIALPWPYVGGLFDKPKSLEELADKSQQNFEALANGALNRTSTKVAPLYAQSTTLRDGVLSGDVVYLEATITLTPGSWVVHASCSMTNLTTDDAVAVGVYNRTTSAEVANSRGAAGHTTTTSWGGCETTVLMTVTTDTDICPYATRNGASTIRVGTASGSIAGRIMATRIGY